jgi:Rieske Fe-S protein
MTKFLHRYFRFFVLLFIFNFIHLSCEKIPESVIPEVSFSFSINLNLHNDVNVAGNSIFIPNIAYGGVIVYCEFPGSFYAFDATCTNEVSKTCLIKNEGVLGTCQCCGSEYMLVGGGFPSTGPAKEGLRQYQTSIINGMLRIYNYAD